jgi:hypothetical protein
MKRLKLVLFIFVVVFPVATFIGCDLTGATIETRINNFLNDINNNRSNAYLNFHETDTQLYNDLKNSDWESLFPSAYVDYYIVNLNTLDSGNVTGEIRCTDTLEWPKDVKFVMSKDGLSWYIDDMYLGSGLPLVIY